VNNTSLPSPTLRVLVIIVNMDRSLDVSKLLERTHIHIQHQFLAEGTASSEILDILGLGAMEKSVTVCMLPTTSINQLLHDTSENLAFDLPGRGVAFTIPISGVSSRALTLIMGRCGDIETKENEVSDMEIDIGHHLIIILANQGYSEAIADAARQAGATGGTVWAARKAGTHEALAILGVPMQEEREIVSILATKENKLAIMNTLNEKFGIASKAQGFILSLPVDNVIGVEKQSK
jgi:hypothetical protein